MRDAAGAPAGTVVFAADTTDVHDAAEGRALAELQLATVEERERQRIARAIQVADAVLGDGDGTDLVELAALRSPAPPVLLITGTDDRRGLDMALRSGCAGFVSKTQGLDRLVDAVVAIAAGSTVFPGPSRRSRPFGSARNNPYGPGPTVGDRLR